MRAAAQQAHNADSIHLGHLEVEQREIGALTLDQLDCNVIVFSAVSALEIAIKTAIGKLALPEPAEEYVTSRLEAMAISPMPIYLPHALRVAELPPHHGDPFDRLLVAQCQVEGLPLLTADAAMASYDVDVIWAARGRAPRGARVPA